MKSDCLSILLFQCPRFLAPLAPASGSLNTYTAKYLLLLLTFIINPLNYIVIRNLLKL